VLAQSSSYSRVRRSMSFFLLPLPWGSLSSNYGVLPFFPFPRLELVLRFFSTPWKKPFLAFPLPSEQVLSKSPLFFFPPFLTLPLRCNRGRSSSSSGDCILERKLCLLLFFLIGRSLIVRFLSFFPHRKSLPAQVLDSLPIEKSFFSLVRDNEDLLFSDRDEVFNSSPWKDEGLSPQLGIS